MADVKYHPFLIDYANPADIPSFICNLNRVQIMAFTVPLLSSKKAQLCVSETLIFNTKNLYLEMCAATES